MNSTLKILFSAALTCISFTLIGQLGKENNIEKGYIQTDKPMYMPGDEIWIKALIVNGANQPTVLSQSATLEMIKPDGSKLFTKEIMIEDGSISEYVQLKPDVGGGIYQLNVKTEWMSILEPGYKYGKEIKIQKYDPPRLLMKIDLDKEAYGMGESVNVSFDVKDLQDRPISNNDLEFTLLVEGREYQKLFSATDQDGKSKTKFTLPQEIRSSNININAKINYRGQIESISKRIPVILDNIDLQFLPEGGHMVEDFENVLAFKALTETGDPADVQGEIINAKGEKIAEFKSKHDGMGSIIFRPEHGQAYFAKICSPYESTSLIPIKSQTSNLAKICIEAHYDNKLHVKIMGNTERNMAVSLSSIYEEVWVEKLGRRKKISIPLKRFSQGIYKLALSSKNNVISERLVFLHPKRKMHVDIKLDKKKYELRDKVTVQIKTTDDLGRPVSADLGVAVTEDKMLSFANDKQAHITSHLLLSSELQGDIHEPNYYFDSISAETLEHLDLVMLTHGWRSYFDVSEDNDVLAHFIGQNSYIGQVLGTGNHKGTAAKVLIYDWHKDEAFYLETDDEGYFTVPFYADNNFHVYAKADEQSVYINDVSMNDLKRQKSEILDALKQEWTDKPQELTSQELPLFKDAFRVDYEDVMYGIEEESAPLNIELNEGALMDAVVVTEYKVPLTQLDNSLSGSVITGADIRSLPVKSINAIAATTAGISVVNHDAIYIRGSRTDATVYYIDGVRVSGSIPQIEAELELSEDDLYNRSYNNTVRINTQPPVAKKYIRTKKQPARARKFYVPRYRKSSPKIRDDFRQTIYWNPNVQTNQNGEATFSFFTSDEITSFSLIAEGITADGQVGRSLEKIITSKAINVDCKLPAYFVIGDTAKLSVIINNDSDRDEEVIVNAFAPGLKLSFSNTQSIKVKKGKSQVVSLIAIPKEELSSTSIDISVKSERFEDYMSKKVSILNPYFPQSLTFSGAHSDTFHIELHSPLMNTLSATFKIRNPVRTAVDGIESILRQPSGCFEQVSSSTYPNVMVYQYLERNKGQHQKSMQKAMNYIKDGYKRLVAYETTEDGFEWFGNTPANVALTAYGLLEFTDMAEIYDGVDVKMLKRTIDFLMNSKDGKGGFIKHRGMDRFGDPKYHVQTAYVLYALSNQKIKKVNLEKEYVTVKSVVNDTKDLYLTALLALTAYNQNKKEDFEKLVEEIKNTLYSTDLSEITCAHTMSRSGTRDKNIETLSLCALAMMKYEDMTAGLVSDVINHILSKKYNGRFGSTQATCLAIKAILAYADWHPQSNQHGEGSILANIDGVFLPENSNEVDFTEHITLNPQNFAVTYESQNAKNFEANIRYLSKIPPSVRSPELDLSTKLTKTYCSLADQVGMEVRLSNNLDRLAANPTVILGIPAGLSLQMDHLKEMKKTGIVDFFEIFENKLVLYFNEMEGHEEKKFLIDLKADIAGSFVAPPSCAYPYYDDQNRAWIK
ncbi:MAG: alpha-2-macroglobulin family protein [Bacteroidota bacterium]